MMDTDEPGEDITLEKLIDAGNLPQVAKVTQGYDDFMNTDHEFSTNDVIKVYRSACINVEISVLNKPDDVEQVDVPAPQNGQQQQQQQPPPLPNRAASPPRPRPECAATITVSARNPTRFRLHLPTKPRVFRTVQELIDRWPLSVRAKRDHQLPPPSTRTGSAFQTPMLFNKDDVLHLVRLDTASDQSMLECKKNDNPFIIKLSADCVGPFVEVVDESKLYTLGELTQTARVPRTLRLRHTDQRPVTAAAAAAQQDELPWINGIPVGFDGLVIMERPKFYVELALLLDADEDREEQQMGPKLLIPMDSPIRVQPRDSDYIYVNGEQLKLADLSKKKTNILPRIVRILDWKEETTILCNHFVRPGQLFVFFERRHVHKLAVTAGRRRFLVPLTHRGRFRRLDDGTRVRLDQLSTRRPDQFPFPMRFHDESDYINLDDDLLPTEGPLRVDGVVTEDSVLVARISDDALDRANVDDAFFIPLRTKIVVSLLERLTRPVRKVMSCRNDNSEEVTDAVYNAVLHPPPVEVGYVRPQKRETANTFRLNTEALETSAMLHRLPQQLPPVSSDTISMPPSPPPMRRRTQRRDRTTSRRYGNSARRSLVTVASSDDSLPAVERVAPTLHLQSTAAARTDGGDGQLQTAINPPRAAGDYICMRRRAPQPAPRLGRRHLHVSHSLIQESDDSDYEIPYSRL